MSESTLLKPIVMGAVIVGIDKMYMQNENMTESVNFGIAGAVGAYFGAAAHGDAGGPGGHRPGGAAERNRLVRPGECGRPAPDAARRPGDSAASGSSTVNSRS